MMKHRIALCMMAAAAVVFPLTLCAQTAQQEKQQDEQLFFDEFEFLTGWEEGNGTWSVEDGMLKQLDTTDRITHISRMVRQKGTVFYEFDVYYLDGLEDRDGGFGIHILIDEPTGLRSWGQNRSLLLWITYDPIIYGTDHFYLQVYESESAVNMDFLNMTGDEYPVPLSLFSPEDFITSSDPVHIRLEVNTVLGTGILYNPFETGTFYPIDLGAPLWEGKYISLRTNSMAVGFDNVRVVEKKQ